MHRTSNISNQKFEEIRTFCVGTTNSGSENNIKYKIQWKNKNLMKHRHDDRLNCANSVGRSTIPGDKQRLAHNL